MMIILSCLYPFKISITSDDSNMKLNWLINMKATGKVSKDIKRISYSESLLILT